MNAVSPAPRPTGLFILAVLLASLLMPSAASSAVPIVAAERMEGCSGGRGGGERDAGGNLYLTCSNDVGIGRASIRVYDATGALAKRIATPAIDGNAYFNDVVPSPDGAFLYVSSQSHKFFRLKRQGDAYVQDAAFRFEDFPYAAGKKTPMGEFLSTDAAGNVYLANGTWVADQLQAPMTVLKYTADGKFLSRFGEWGNERKLGELYWMVTDIVATRDGVNVYTTEVGNNRVQRWEQQFNTHTYTAKEIFGNTAADDVPDDPNTAGDQSRRTVCNIPGKFGAPYASALDTQGHLYVLQTNCYDGGTLQVQRLEGGTWTILKGTKFGDAQAHAMAIDAKGNIYSPSVNTVLRVTGYRPGPTPPVDATAPTLTSATLPATSVARAVTLQLVATDNVGVTQVRVANENQAIENQPWKAYAAQLPHELTAGDGAKTVTAQVRDAAGNISPPRVAQTVLTIPVDPPVEQPPLANAAPVVLRVDVPSPISSSTATIAIDARDDSGVAQVRLATEDGNWKPWQPFAAIAQFQFSPGTGTRGVFVQVRDAQGLESNIVYKTTTVTGAGAGDTMAPTLTGATLPATSAARAVTLHLAATDNVGVTQVRVANENEAIEARPWKAYAAQLPHELTAGNGAKTVTVQVRDAAGNTSATATVRTTLAIPPTPVVNEAPVLFRITVPATTASQAVEVSIDARDDKSVTQMRFATEDGSWQGWQAFAPTGRFTLSPGTGMKVIYVQVRDAEGAESTILQKALNYTGPTPPVQVPTNAAPKLVAVDLPATTSARPVQLAINATDDSGVTEMRFATEDGNWNAWMRFSALPMFTLSQGVGIKGVFVQVRDAQKAESTVLYRTTQLVAPATPVPPNPKPPTTNPPAIDVAPTVQSVTLPSTTTTQLVRVLINASDDRGITHMRLANEDGNWRPWRAYAPRVDWLLTPNRMFKGVYVQVRDSAGHESNIVFKTTLCSPCHAPGKVLAAKKQASKSLRGSSRADRIRPNRLAQDFDFSQRDGKRDVIDCGAGYDTVLKRPEDTTRNCERVVTLADPRKS